MLTRRQRIGIVLFATVAFAAVAYVILASFVLHGRVTDRTLGMSVALEGGATDPQTSGCRAAERPREYTCTYLRDSSSGAMYRVRVERGGSCWTAERLQGAPEPKRLEGCVRRWQWSLWG